MSRRVFVVGGGLAPGQNGGNIPNGVNPVNIGVSAGTGVPGGFSGANHKTSAKTVSAGSPGSTSSPTTVDTTVADTIMSDITAPVTPEFFIPAANVTDSSQKAANEATAAAAIAKTNEARVAAINARSAAANAKTFENQENTSLHNAFNLKIQASSESDVAIKNQLLAAAQKEQTQADDFKAKAANAAANAQTFDNVALAEVANPTKTQTLNNLTPAQLANQKAKR